MLFYGSSLCFNIELLIKMQVTATENMHLNSGLKMDKALVEP